MAFLVPLSLRLTGRTCVVVGGGRVAERRVESLLEGEANVRVVAPAITAGLHSLHQSGRIAVVLQHYSADLLTDAFLVVVATNEPELNERVCRDAIAQGCLVNDADEPSRGDCQFPAVLKRGDLVISITTGGASPSLTGRIRERLEAEYGSEYAPYLEILGDARTQILATIPNAEARRALLNRLADDSAILDLIRDGKADEARKKVLACISSSLD